MGNSRELTKTVYLIGHVSGDRIDQSNETVMGGAVAYMARVFKLLGWDAHIVTKLPSDHRFLKDLDDLGITVHNLPISTESKKESVTTFDIKNRGGYRDIFLRDRQENITEGEIRLFFRNIPREALVVVAPIMNEVDMDIIPYLKSKDHTLVLCPQGYFRKKTEEQRVYQWDNPEFMRVLSYADMAVMSREDLSFFTQQDKQDKYIKELASIKPIFVTDGGYGSACHYHGSEIKVKALPLNRSEKWELTGAGDAYAAALLHSISIGQPLALDMEFASFYAGIKILKGGGIIGLPDANYIRNFIYENTVMVEGYSPMLLLYILGREAYYEPSDYSFRRIET